MDSGRTVADGEMWAFGGVSGLPAVYTYRRRMLLLGFLAILIGMVAALAHSAAGSPPVRLVTVGYGATAIVIDARAERAFVLNRNTDGNGSPFGPGSVSVIDTQSGAVLHTTPVGTLPNSIAVDEHAGRVVITNPKDGSVSLLNARNGALLYRVHLPALVGGPGPVAVDEQSGRAFVVNTGDGTVGVLDTRRGVLLRMLRVPAAIALYGADVGIAVDANRDRVFIGRSSIGVTQAFGLPLHTGIVSILDGRNGRYVGTMPVNQDVDHVAVDAATGHVVVASDAGVSVLDPGSGRILHTVFLAATLTQPAWDTRSGRALVAGMNGGVYVFDARHGSVSSHGVGAPGAIAAMAMDERRGLTLICTAGSVRVLDARSMTLLRAAPVQGCDGGLALDEPTGRAFALSSGGTAVVSNPWGWLPPWARRWLPFRVASTPQSRLTRGSVCIIDGV